MLGEVLASPPSDVEEFNPVTVSPGLPGFITMFLLAAVVVLLVLDMTRRVRRVQATERVEQRMAAEREGAAQDPSGEEPAEADGAAEREGDRGSDDDAANRDAGAGEPDGDAANQGEGAGGPDGDAGTDSSRPPQGD